MSFGEKLDTITNIFGINSNRLARAINLDPSLISKWKNGKRSLKANSVFADRIASYFANLEAPAFQKNELVKALKSINSSLEYKSKEELKGLILEWLFSESTVAQTSVLGELDSAQSISRIMSSVKSIPVMLTNDKVSNSQNDKISYEIKPGQLLSFELFEGNEGKRQAIMTLLNIALNSEEPLEFLWTSQEDMLWLTEDKQFLALWTKTVIKVLSMGHRLIMIHYLDRSANEIVNILGNWLPITMTGRVESYYYPRYQSRSMKMSFMIIKNKLGIISMSPEDQSSGNYFVLYKDPLIVKNLEKIYMSILSNCQPLIKVYSIKRVKEMAEDMLDNLYRPGHFYVLSEGLSNRTIPQSLYSGLLFKAGFNQREVDMCLDIYKSMHNLFHTNLKNYPQREIYTHSVFDAIIREKEWKYSSMEFSGRSVIEDASDLKEHLYYIIDMLKKYPNYEIAINEAHQTDLQTRTILELKESYFLSVGAFDINGDNSVLFSTGESVIMYAFEHYFNEMWDNIPKSNKDKEQVILKLQKYIRQL